MKKVWVSTIIAVVIVGASLYYSYQNQKQLKAFKEDATQIRAPQDKPTVAIHSQVTEVYAPHEITEEAPLNFDDETLSEEVCCPEEEIGELFEMQSDTFAELKPNQESESKSETTDSYRDLLIKRHGYSPDIDRYLLLEESMMAGGRKHLPELLEWARLTCVYNPSEDAQAFYDELKAYDEIPDHLKSELVLESQ